MSLSNYSSEVSKDSWSHTQCKGLFSKVKRKGENKIEISDSGLVHKAPFLGLYMGQCARQCPWRPWCLHRPSDTAQLCVTEMGLLVHTHRRGCYLSTWYYSRAAVPWDVTSFRHSLLSTFSMKFQSLVENPDDSALLTVSSFLGPLLFFVLSCPQISVIATPTKSPNLRVSFKASLPEGPLSAKENSLVSVENYAN